MSEILKRKYRYLYIAIACFAALVAIFVVDGYMGIYDTVYVTVREYTQKIEADYWLQQYPYSTPVPEDGDAVTYCCIYASAGENIDFRYEIANHNFSAYSTHVSASVWQQNKKILDLLSSDVSAAPFDEATIGWQLSTTDLEGTDFVAPSEQNQYAQCTVRINHGQVERRIIVEFNYPGGELVPPVVKY